MVDNDAALGTERQTQTVNIHDIDGSEQSRNAHDMSLAAGVIAFHLQIEHRSRTVTEQFHINKCCRSIGLDSSSSKSIVKVGRNECNLQTRTVYVAATTAITGIDTSRGKPVAT